MLAAGSQALPLALLVGLSERRATNFAASLLAGLAYMIRYTAFVTGAPCLLFLVGRALMQRRHSTWAAAGLFLPGFLVGAAVQIIPSTLVTGNPFYSSQARNIRWHLKG
jgi:hypothetical protein